MSHSLKQSLVRLGFVVGVVVAISFIAHPALAQNFIEPTSPLGGSTAWPLNSSANTQYKSGSLIIGSSTNPSPSSLCLNTNNPADPTNCIKSWGDVVGSFVTLGKGNVADTTIGGHKVSSSRTADIGFARIQADSTTNQLYTVIAEANSYPSTGSAVGVLATDGGNTTNYAAEFLGRVFIGASTAAGTSDSQFCLNGTMNAVTNPADTNYGRGCIKRWSDLSAFAPPGNYVTLQPIASVAVPEFGQIAISGTGTFATSQGAVVIGAPAGTTPSTLTCGDGICNGMETVLTCAVDCDRTPPFDITNLTIDSNFRSAMSYGVDLAWVKPTATDFAGVRILIASTPPTSPTMSGATVITVPKTTSHRLITPLNYGTTYYMALYTFDTLNNYSAGRSINVRIDSPSSGCVSGTCPIMTPADF